MNEEEQEYYSFWCENGNYDPLATIFFASEGEVIRNIMSSNVETTLTQLCIFAFCWYVMTIITYGVNCPAGLFLPGMIIGCAIGNIYAIVLWNSGMIQNSEYEDLRKNLIVIGVAATLAGYTRMTYSLAVIVMETSQVMNLFVPIVFTIIISREVGSVYTRSLYERAVRGKQMPILIDNVPRPCKSIIAEDFMCKKVVAV